MLIANLLGIFSLLFIFWKRLKDDYQLDKLFNLAFIVLMGLLLGVISSNYFFSEYWFWIIIFCVFVPYLIYIKWSKVRFFESYDALTVSGLTYLAIYLIMDAFKSSSLISFVAFWLTLLIIFLFYFIDSFYKTFSWYKSGRVGLAGVLSSLVFFAFRIISSLFNFQVSTFSPQEVYFSSTFVLVNFLLLLTLIKPIK